MPGYLRAWYFEILSQTNTIQAPLWHLYWEINYDNKSDEIWKTECATLYWIIWYCQAGSQSYHFVEQTCTVQGRWGLTQDSAVCRDMLDGFSILFRRYPKSTKKIYSPRWFFFKCKTRSISRLKSSLQTLPSTESWLHSTNLVVLLPWTM